MRQRIYPATRAAISTRKPRDFECYSRSRTNSPIAPKLQEAGLWRLRTQPCSSGYLGGGRVGDGPYGVGEALKDQYDVRVGADAGEDEQDLSAP